MSETMETAVAAPMPVAPGEFPLPLRSMLDAGVHFGHQTKRWNPKMRPFIYGARNGIHIIDLDQSVRLFKRAYDFVVDAVGRGGSVLFVGTKRQAQEIVQEEATRSGSFFVVNRWLGGTLTNFRTIKGGLERMRRMPPSAWFSLSISSDSLLASFLVRRSNSPASRRASSASRR